MTFYKLNQICSLLWGQSWQTELSIELNIDRRTVSKWKKQGVAKWVYPELQKVINNRVSDVLSANDIYKNYSLDD